MGRAGERASICRQTSRNDIIFYFSPAHPAALKFFSTFSSIASGRLQKKSIPVSFSSSSTLIACESKVSSERQVFVCSLQKAMAA